jgi:hypothetical protein
MRGFLFCISTEPARAMFRNRTDNDGKDQVRPRRYPKLPRAGTEGSKFREAKGRKPTLEPALLQRKKAPGIRPAPTAGDCEQDPAPDATIARNRWRQEGCRSLLTGYR